MFCEFLPIPDPMATDSNPVHAVVIGGGITGLAAAFRLYQRLNILGRPYKVTVLEATDRVGGTIRTVRQNDALLEAGPDCFLSEKPRGVGLAQELGISRDLISMPDQHRRSLIYSRGKLHPVPAGFYLLAPSQLESML